MDRSRTHETTTARREQSRTHTRPDAALVEREWDAIKTRFVDDPRGAVVEASRMVREIIDRTYEALRDECDALGTGVDGRDTEEMRRSLHRFRAILERLEATTVH